MSWVEITVIVLLVIAASAAIVFLVPYSPTWLDVSAFWVIIAITLIVTVLAILDGKGVFADELDSKTIRPDLYSLPQGSKVVVQR